MTKEQEQAVLKRAITIFGTNIQFLKTIEELGELTRAISRYLSGNELQFEDNFNNLVEEITDVEIMIEQVKIMLANSSILDMLQEYRTKKLERLERRLDAVDKVKEMNKIDTIRTAMNTKIDYPDKWS